MDQSLIPTKANLIQTRGSLSLAKAGWELLDRKRSILIREMTAMLDDVRGLQGRINAAFAQAYALLQRANMTVGQSDLLDIVESRAPSGQVSVTYKSVMGVELPAVKPASGSPPELFYGLERTNNAFDGAYIKFCEVRDLAAAMAGYENSVYRLAYAIRQTQRRANALRNVVIPRLEAAVTRIAASLEEKDRDAFTALKVIKRKK